MKNPAVLQLEAMIDKYDLRSVLVAIGQICNEKSVHVAETWQDNNLARKWHKAGARVDALAESTAIRALP